MIDAGLLSLKQHRAEVGLAAAAAFLVGGFALLIYAMSSESPAAEPTSYILGAMKVLPFGLGLVGGIPVVSRELEMRTAQVAWSLNASRLRWLGRQTLPILLLLGVAMAFAAIAAAAVAADRESVAEQAFLNIGSHGFPAVARAVGAFGLGLFVGAFFGRALPALIVGAGMLLLFFSIAASARDAWIIGQGPIVPVTDPAAIVQTGWAMTDPDGTRLSVDQAMTLVPATEEDPGAWLEANGYEWLALGISRDTALVWAWYDSALFLVIGAAAFGGTAVLVNRRRPT